MHRTEEPVADAAMDAKLREIWAAFPGQWARRKLRAMLPPTEIETLGCRFIVHPRDNYTEFRMWEDRLLPEREGTEAVIEWLMGTDAVIVDVGANAGAFSLPVLRGCGAGAHALMFEPNPVMRDRLSVNIALNGFENARVFDCAISDAPGRSRLHFPRNGNLGQGRVTLGYERAGKDGVEVEIRTLPDCLREAGVDRVDFLKVDVEGLEDRVICPLLDAGGPLPELLYFEVAHDLTWARPLLEMLTAAGYREIGNFRENALYQRVDG